MSTKNLARTVIEGGRARFNRFQRWQSNGHVRAQSRALARALCSKLDYDDQSFPVRQHVYRLFDDKLSVPTRWLERQAGRPWDRVRSELMQRFDARTTAGRHILFDHVLPSIEGIRGDGLDHDLFVNDHGILCRSKSRRGTTWRHSGHRAPLPEPEDVLEAWLAGRRIAVRGHTPFWFTRTNADAFRQSQRLTDEEARRYRALPEWYRDLHSPTAPLPTQQP